MKAPWKFCIVFAAGIVGYCYSSLLHHDPELKASSAFASILVLLMSLSLSTWHNPIGRRVLAAGVFAFFSVSLMAISSAVAWYRNPKHAGHLPDLLHEAVPHVESLSLPFSWRFTADARPFSIGSLEAAEFMLSAVVAVTAAWVLLQKWRWLVLRRACVVYATLALLRSVTILVTAVPDASPRCSVSTPGTFVLSELPWKAAFSRGIAIIVGHLSDPCRSAGDMVFSGHSMVLVLCGMLWHAYYRPAGPGIFTINPVKFTIWICVASTLFLIVVSRLHYTLDVFLAVYFAITLFNAYHRVADDVLVGHRFVAVWLFDGLLIYPFVEWMEAPHLGEAAAAGMVSKPLTQGQAATLPVRQGRPRSLSEFTQTGRVEAVVRPLRDGPQLKVVPRATFSAGAYQESRESSWKTN
jgi:PAP2 superfamily C-terminal